ncbi:MAG: DUF4288 domain-containing protein, partial [Cyclobacteriaceae bacterium]|nr:DUF4288 domain-containing protein [Cyclobacteriaceae bacterium]
MNWYVAKIIFRIVSVSPDDHSQFDEHLRLIEADNFEEALLKARMIGIQEEDPIEGHQGRSRWEFINVPELVPVASLAHGTELFSKVKEVNEAESYIRHIH